MNTLEQREKHKFVLESFRNCIKNCIQILETQSIDKAYYQLAAINISSFFLILCKYGSIEEVISEPINYYKKILHYVEEYNYILIAEESDYRLWLEFMESIIISSIFLNDENNLSEKLENLFENSSDELHILDSLNFLTITIVKFLLSSALFIRFNYFGNLSDLDESIEVIYEVKASLKNILPDADISNFSIYKLGCALFQRGRISEALKQLQELQSIVEKQDNVELLALTMYEIARIYHRLGRLEQARLYFKDSLRLFRRLGDRKRVAAALTGLGNLELQIGHFSSAQQHLDEARQYYEAESQVDRVEEIEKLLALLPIKNNAINQSTSCQGV